MSDRIHTLKTWPEPFEAVAEGRKPFEVRWDDRDFRVGDYLLLQEYIPDEDRGFTGREIMRQVTFVLPGGQFDLPIGVVVMGLVDHGRVDALERELLRCSEHLRDFAAAHPMESSTDIDGALYCAEQLLNRTQANSSPRTGWRGNTPASNLKSLLRLLKSSAFPVDALLEVYGPNTAAGIGLRDDLAALLAPSDGQDKTLRELQTSLPWTAHYHRDFRATPMTHKDFSHALLHVHKAGGKLATILDEAEHGGFEWASPANRAEVSKYIADLVICALRMATTCPDGQLDLQRAVEDRLTTKNNFLAEVAPTLAAAERAT